MAYEDLTPSEQASLQAWLNTTLRPVCGEQGRTSNLHRTMHEEYLAVQQTILAQLVGGDIVPNTSGLSGAENLTKDEIVTLVSYSDGILTNYDQALQRQLMGKAAGEINMTRGTQ